MSIHEHMQQDEQLRQALFAETPDASGVVAAVRARIRQEEYRKGLQRRWIAIAAVAVLTLGSAITWAVSGRPETKVVTAAVHDHRAEVLQNSPRRWKATIPAMQPLLEQYRVGWSDVQTLLPAGYVLAKAKECRLGGEQTLHMVFSDGTRDLSVFVRAEGLTTVPRPATLDGAEVAGFRRGSISGLVVAAGAPGLCAEAVRRLTAL